jgi:hypothetical protein
MTLLTKTLGYFARFLNPLNCCRPTIGQQPPRSVNGTTDTVLNIAVMSGSNVDFWVVTQCSWVVTDVSE